ncbi:fungal-specific transcription factor domain-containing protein [Apodospora peruviana]|uniref:Fungal-specific transcription factor domain-containing protein n=1 Tax=Apodospora peruviana TaxID=516989 RepID=A0AAE0I1R7_9PEZI|nr:fungal-specific transcription factor domain-containing protein [Apodospora peruviana]
MPKRTKHSDSGKPESEKRRKVARDPALEVQCPFRVHARNHSLDYPQDRCKEGQTFKGNEKLNEHLDRCHSLRYWCPDCRKRFPFNSQDNLAVLKTEHKNQCTGQAPPEHEEEWASFIVMDREQFGRWSNRNWKKIEIPRKEGETMPRYSWRQIYKSLFPETVELPNPLLPHPAPSQPGSMSPSEDHEVSASPRQQDCQPAAEYDSDPESTSIDVYDPDAAEAVTRYIGQNSIPALLREQTANLSSNDPHQQPAVDVRQDMRSLFGLDNSAPFPLMSAAHLNRASMDVAAALPSNLEVLKLFRTYQETPHQFWGFVLDINDFESRLFTHLADRAKSTKTTTRGSGKLTKPVSASWLAVLFAVLAVGSQYHDSPYHIRTRESLKYIQAAFHFLRLGNFLSRPNLDSIQALLMTCFVLLNDMKAEASWALLSLTCRLAQSLGLDRSPPAHPAGLLQLTEEIDKEVAKQKLWWTCVWHDAFTSLSFDRSPMANLHACRIPGSESREDGFSYLEGMYRLCQIVSKRLNPDAAANVTYAEILDSCNEVTSVSVSFHPHLRNKESCKSARDRLQHFSIRLYTSFVISVCCRPALRTGPRSNHFDNTQKRILADRCKSNLTETVRMFLAMHQLSVLPTRSWEFTYFGLSSAVLLGILDGTKTDPEVRALQGDLISALSATAAKETSRDIELSGPLARALTALKNIYDHGTITLQRTKEVGSKFPTSSQIPDQIRQGTGSAQNRAGTQPQTVFPVDSKSHQGAPVTTGHSLNTWPVPDWAGYDGAVASSSTTLAPFPGSQVPDLATFDPATYMSPMDLYDSIFWESPDPFNTVTDMPGDFIGWLFSSSRTPYQASHSSSFI